MSNITKWSLILLTALGLVVFATGTAAAAASTAPETVPADPPAGSPEYGLLVIAGLVGFLVLVTWLFARVGDTSHGTSDKSILN